MQQYKNLLKTVLAHGTVRKDRTGVGTISIFGHQERFDLRNKFPAVTVKPLYFKTMVTETLWFLGGTGDVSYLEENNCKIWESWTDPMSKSVGPMYPVQLRNWNGHIDQLKNVIEGIQHHPFSRRHLISYWNPEVLPDESKTPIDNVRAGKAALAACHTFLQFYVSDMSVDEIVDNMSIKQITMLITYLMATKDVPTNDYSIGESADLIRGHLKKLLKDKNEDEYFSLIKKYDIRTRYISSLLYLRSADVAVGTPFNIAQYALLTHIVGRITNTKPRELIVSFGDAHIYLNQVENVKTMLEREPMVAPTLQINSRLKTLKDFTENATVDDFELVNYHSHPALPKVKVAV